MLINSQENLSEGLKIEQKFFSLKEKWKTAIEISAGKVLQEEGMATAKPLGKG
jgi:hypothetical protein